MPTTAVPTTEFSTTTAVPQLSSPSDLFVLEVNSSCVILVWSSVTQPVGVAVTYIVEQKEAQLQRDWKVVAKKIQSNRYTVLGLTPNTEYMFAVRTATDKGRRSTRTKISKPVRTLKAKGELNLPQYNCLPIKNQYSLRTIISCKFYFFQFKN